MSLLEELSIHTAQKVKRPKGAGRQMFIAQQTEIKSAIDNGYPALEIWEYLNKQGKMPISYGVFCDYVYRFNKKNQSQTIVDTTKENGQVVVVDSDSGNRGKQWQPRGLGNVPTADYFQTEVNMDDAFKAIE